MNKLGLRLLLVLVMISVLVAGLVSTVSAASPNQSITVDISNIRWDSTNGGQIHIDYSLAWNKFGAYSYELEIYYNTSTWIAGSGSSFWGKRTASFSDTETGVNAYPINRQNLSGDYTMALTLFDRNGVKIPGATASDTFTYTASTP